MSRRAVVVCDRARVSVSLPLQFAMSARDAADAELSVTRDPDASGASRCVSSCPSCSPPHVSAVTPWHPRLARACMCVCASFGADVSRRGADRLQLELYGGSTAAEPWALDGVMEALSELGDTLVVSAARDILGNDASWMRSSPILLLATVLQHDSKCVCV